MQLLGLRLLAVSLLVLLYEMNAVVGVAALASGVGYVIGQRTRRQSA